MDCSKRIFILHEKHGSRYVLAEFREKTARAIVQQRLDDGYWYDQKTVERINKLWHVEHHRECFFQFLKSRSSHQYEGFEVAYLEDLFDKDNVNDRS